ncbi:Tm-1-like ATP-binding domain-containing protein [Serratia fonticola]
MAKSVYIIGTADTKLKELLWIKSCLQVLNVSSVIVDVSTRSVCENPMVDVDIADLLHNAPEYAHLMQSTERAQTIQGMSLAVSKYLVSVDNISGIIGIGGSCGTAIITPAMHAMPIGMPKIMVSTMAAGDVKIYVGSSDIAMLYPVTDLQGLNTVTQPILANAAAMMAGAVQFHHAPSENIRQALGLTMFGVTTPCIENITPLLEPDYDSLVFHATGNGGQSMEKLAAEGKISGIIDITTTEIADLLFDGVLSCTSQRLDVVAATQLPYVGSCGALDMVNFWGIDRIPDKYRDRQFFEHNSNVTLMRTTSEESAELGIWIARKLNSCNGPLRFIIPMGGFSALDHPGQPFYSPECTEAFTNAFENTFVQTEDRQLIKSPYHINDSAFAELVVHSFNEVKRRN